jgi:hypothetical protein
VEKLGTMEEVAAKEWRQRRTTRIDGHTYGVHDGKISKKYVDNVAIVSRFL